MTSELQPLLIRALAVALPALAALSLAASAEGERGSLRIGIIGDSTVSTYAENDVHRGWGQALASFFSPQVTILNQAKPGASTKTFPPERWQTILTAKPDFVLIQFGHNDQHDKTKPEATDAATDYKENLRRFVQDARGAGATPILVTPMHRRTFDRKTQRLTSELGPYVRAMTELAEQLKVPVVDLYGESGKLFESLGEDGSTALTVNNIDKADHPGQGDRTHFTAEGARAMAKIVAAALAGIDPRFKAALAPSQP